MKKFLAAAIVLASFVVSGTPAFACPHGENKPEEKTAAPKVEKPKTDAPKTATQPKKEAPKKEAPKTADAGKVSQK